MVTSESAHDGTSAWQRMPDGRLRAARVFTDRALDDRFWNTGMAVLDLLDPDELQDVRNSVAQLRPADNWDPRSLDAPRGTYHCTFLDPSREYRAAANQLVRDLLGPKLREILPDYRFLTANIYSKPPGTGRFEVHQNWPTLADIDIPTLTAWIPLQDTGLRNGTVRAVPGSHRIFPDVAAATSTTFFADFEPELIESYLEPVCMSAGQVFAFDDSLIHWSGANRSDKPRVSFQVELIPDGLQPVLWIADPAEPGQFSQWVVDSDFFESGGIEDLYGTPQGLRLAAVVPNPNRRLTLEEFDATLADAQAIRAGKYQFA